MFGTLFFLCLCNGADGRNGEDDNKLANWNRTLTEAGYVLVEKAGEADIVLLDVKPDFPANNGCMNTLDLVEDL